MTSDVGGHDIYYLFGPHSIAKPVQTHKQSTNQLAKCPHIIKQ